MPQLMNKGREQSLSSGSVGQESASKESLLDPVCLQPRVARPVVLTGSFIFATTATLLQERTDQFTKRTQQTLSFH